MGKLQLLHRDDGLMPKKIVKGDSSEPSSRVAHSVGDNLMDNVISSITIPLAHTYLLVSRIGSRQPRNRWTMMNIASGDLDALNSRLEGAEVDKRHGRKEAD